MCSNSRVQYESIHCITLEDCIITGIAIEHCGLFKEIPLQKPYLLIVPFTLVKRQKFKKRQEFRHTRKQTMCIIHVHLKDMIFAVDFLHTTSTILQCTLKQIYEYGAFTVFYTQYYLTSMTFLNYINLSSTTAVTIYKENVIYLNLIKKKFRRQTVILTKIVYSVETFHNMTTTFEDFVGCIERH